jgi:hypothetical protein
MEQVYLSEGRKYVKHTIPEGPGVIKVQQARMERVFTLLLVPLAMVTQTSSVGGKRSMNENVLLLFNNARKLMKQKLINYMHSMFALIYEQHYTMHALAELTR